MLYAGGRDGNVWSWDGTHFNNVGNLVYSNRCKYGVSSLTTFNGDGFINMNGEIVVKPIYYKFFRGTCGI